MSDFIQSDKKMIEQTIKKVQYVKKKLQLSCFSV